MSKKRNHYSPEEKVLILKKQLVEKVPVSDICDAYDYTRRNFIVGRRNFSRTEPRRFA
jgi:transposase-like protein